MIAFDAVQLADHGDGLVGTTTLAFRLHLDGLHKASAHVRPANQAFDAFGFCQLIVAAYSGERDRSFWSIVTAAHEMVLRG